MTPEEAVSPSQARLAADLRRVADLLELHAVPDTGLLEQGAAFARRIVEIPTNNAKFNFSIIPPEIKEHIVKFIFEPTFVDLLIAGRVSREWEGLVKNCIEPAWKVKGTTIDLDTVERLEMRRDVAATADKLEDVL